MMVLRTETKERKFQLFEFDGNVLSHKKPQRLSLGCLSIFQKKFLQRPNLLAVNSNVVGKEKGIERKGIGRVLI